MLVTALEREREQFFQNGLREGEQKGKQEGLREGEQKGKQEGLREGEQKGRIEEKIETAKTMLAKGMEITLISEITDLPEAQLLQLKEELSSVKK